MAERLKESAERLARDHAAGLKISIAPAATSLEQLRGPPVDGHHIADGRAILGFYRWSGDLPLRLKRSNR